MKNRKWLTLIFFVVLLCAVVFSFLVYTDPYEALKNDPLNPGDDYPAYELLSYDIDSETILASIKNGSGNVFFSSDFRPWEDGMKEDIYPSGTFNWSQEDYLTVAKAHHLFLTGEVFEDGWSVFRHGGFYINNCTDFTKGFDYANVIFYKRSSDGSFPATYIDIYPLSESIESAYINYEPRRNDSGFDETDVVNGKISAEDALNIAEMAGGEESRRKLSNNGCKVAVEYYADEYWRVSYRWTNYQLEFKVNAYDGSYEWTRR